MKTIFSFAFLAIFTFVCVGFSASAVSAQITYSKDVDKARGGVGSSEDRVSEEVLRRFESSKQYLNDVVPVKEADRDSKGNLPSVLSKIKAKSNNIGPGDNYRFATQCTDSEPRSRVNTRCWVTNTYIGEIIGLMQCAQYSPGKYGRYDGTIPAHGFNPVGSQSGLLRFGGVFERMDLFDIKFPPDSIKGEYIFNCVLWDSQGLPIQQTIFALNLIHSGPTKPLYYINDGKAQKLLWKFYGNFLEGAPHYFLGGIEKDGEVVNHENPQFASYPAPGGKTIDVLVRMGSCEERMHDITFWSPGLRIAIMKQKVVREPARECQPQQFRGDEVGTDGGNTDQ